MSKLPSIRVSEENINIDEYRDKVLGCWTGKNIGGTLGAPFEGMREMQNVSFYTQELNGNPAPNDDLDLQLIWLFAAEKHGLYNLSERLLGEYWMQNIIGPWSEYAVCRANIRNGLYPPLSGSCNNERWKNSNGAWIRSEIWACLFPGEPDHVLQFAYMDACADHSGDGIYAEMFTASLEAAAFVVNDIRKLIDIGLSKIPSDCRVTRSVKLACELYDKKTDFANARNTIVKDSEDLGWFQAPANIAFTVLGLLYGEGDFGKSICLAVNCGDDTDCTGATAGAILGIMKGRSGIPSEWIKPIGESIQTIAINPLNGVLVPKNLSELTERVIYLASSVQYECPTIPKNISGKTEYPMILKISSGATQVSEKHIESLSSAEFAEKNLWTKFPYALTFDLPFGQLTVDYENGPEVLAGETKNIRLSFASSIVSNTNIRMKWLLPEDWTVIPSQEMQTYCRAYTDCALRQTIKVGNFEGAFFYMPLEVKLVERNNPVILNVPLQKKDSVVFNHSEASPIGDRLQNHRVRVKFAEEKR